MNKADQSNPVLGEAEMRGGGHHVQAVQHDLAQGEDLHWPGAAFRPATARSLFTLVGFGSSV